MISNKPKFLTVVLPLATLMSVGIAQSASARKPTCRDVPVYESRYTGERVNNPIRSAQPCGGGYLCENTYDNWSDVTVSVYAGTVNKCSLDTSVGAVVNVGNGSPGYGASVKYPVSQNFSLAIRGTYLYTQDKTDHGTLALTHEIDLGAADVFIGGGYNADKRATDNPSDENKRFNYPFATAGVDYRITPNIDLNLGIIIPVSGGSNATNYNIGIALNF